MPSDVSLPTRTTQYSGNTDIILEGSLVLESDGYVPERYDRWGNNSLSKKYNMNENMSMGDWADWYLLVEIPENVFFDELSLSGKFNETYQGQSAPYNHAFLGVFEEIPESPIYKNINNVTGTYQIQSQSPGKPDAEWSDFNYSESSFGNFEQNYLLIGLSGNYENIYQLPSTLTYTPQVLFHADSIEAVTEEGEEPEENDYVFEIYRTSSSDFEGDKDNPEELDLEQWELILTLSYSEKDQYSYIDSNINFEIGQCYTIKEVNLLDEILDVRCVLPYLFEVYRIAADEYDGETPDLSEWEKIHDIKTFDDGEFSYSDHNIDVDSEYCYTVKEVNVSEKMLDVVCLIRESYFVELTKLEGQGSVTIGDSVLENVGDSVEVLADAEIDIEADAAEYYNFTSWSEDADGKEDSAFNITINNDYNIGVTFKKVIHLITLVEKVGEGKVVVGNDILKEESDIVEVDDGKQVSISTETDTGWNFASWSEDFADQGAEFKLTVNEDYNIGVTFDKEKRTLTIKAIEHGKQAGEKSTVTVMVDGQRREEIETGTSATIEVQKGASVDLVSNEGEYSPFIAWADEHD